jgi:hypothetical protein
MTTNVRSWPVPFGVAVGLGLATILGGNRLSSSPPLPNPLDYSDHMQRVNGAIAASAAARERHDWDTMWREQIKADHESLCYWDPNWSTCGDWRMDRANTNP